jgi:hypothetical protein
MQEAPHAPTAPGGFLNRFTFVSMAISTIGGSLLSLAISALALDQINRIRVNFTIPAERSYYEKTVIIDGPGKPWLCLASAILLVTFLISIPTVYRLLRRKKSAIASTKLTTQLMSAGGLCFLAGAETYYGTFLFGFLLLAYAGIGYLAYTRWERVRVQLYKD